MENLNLNPGEIMLVSAKGTKGNKVQLEFAQIIPSTNTSTSILGMLNASDDRFNQTKARRAWVSGEKADIKKIFDIDVTSLEEGVVLEIGKLNPTINNQPLNIQITETTKGTDYDVANFEKTAKRAGKDGDFILTSSGEYIYVKTDVVSGEAKHQFITDLKVNTSSVAESAINSALGK